MYFCDSVFVDLCNALEINFILSFSSSTLDDLDHALKELDKDQDASDMSTDSEEDEMYYRSVKRHTNHPIYTSNTNTNTPLKLHNYNPSSGRGYNHIWAIWVYMVLL